ncbi:E3 ubiquitin-protein ligase RMND5A-like [Chironomus tepperi]|uniref:E3 ubiquitin-protein ligase RMND5A-like n=1 Tax=Chironomus tepperi TaxID=113505 RepID=UPI00391F2028
MDAIDAVEKEIEKVISKFSGVKKQSEETLDEIISVLSVCSSSLCRMDSDATIPEQQANELKNVIARCKAKLQSIGTEHRGLHATVSKVGKAIDRHFTPDYQSIAPMDVFESDKYIEILNQIISEHFYRQGMNGVAESLVNESALPPEEDIHLELFADLFQMSEAILNKNLGPALEWVTQYSSELDARNSTLEFKLRRLAYLQLLEQGVNGQAEAIAYTRAHFNKFINKFEKEIQMLMGCLIYLGQHDFQNTPYSMLFKEELWVDGADSFIQESCEIVGVNRDSSLEIIINSGCYALPALMNLKQIMVKNRVSSVWSERNELPIEIDLGPEYRYHSVFTCPILKLPSTEQNPPMRLKCGHVISKDAMQKLTRGLMLKCPYCPKESTVSEAKKIFF